jgi:hypothetical protein
MPDCISCGDGFPFLTTEKCNGCTALDACETAEAKEKLIQVIQTKMCRGCSVVYVHTRNPICNQCVCQHICKFLAYSLTVTKSFNMAIANVANGQVMPIEFASDKDVTKFLNTRTTVSCASQGMPSIPDQSILAAQGGLTVGTDVRGTTNLMLQAAPYMQAVATSF